MGTVCFPGGRLRMPSPTRLAIYWQPMYQPSKPDTTVLTWSGTLADLDTSAQGSVLDLIRNTQYCDRFDVDPPARVYVF